MPHVYDPLVSRRASPGVASFRNVVAAVVPEDGTIAVVSRGDSALLELGKRDAWHFPRRADGVYAGYYPQDSAAAIKHLEALRDRGAEFIAFPASAMWWLDHYVDLAAHLEANYELIASDASVGAIYALVDGRAVPHDVRADGGSATAVRARPSDDLLGVLDAAYYGRQAGIDFPSDEDALTHYLRRGHAAGLNPNVLFDARWYVERNPDATLRKRRAPLLHFLEHGAARELDPGPFFDSAYYYRQRPDLRDSGINPLVHYLTASGQDESPKPNPLFDDGYYRLADPTLSGSPLTALEHFLQVDAAHTQFMSGVHRNMLSRVRKLSVSNLRRGNWKRGSVVVFLEGGDTTPAVDLSEVTLELVETHRLDVIVVVLRRTPEQTLGKALVLEDYELAADVLRPSAVRLLARSLWRLRPLFSLTQVHDVADTLRAGTPGTYDLSPAGENDPASAAMGRTLRRRRSARSRAEAIVEGAARDFGVDPVPGSAQPRAAHPAPTKLIMACSDWGVSGVNAALEVVGTQLVERGWDAEILFTREEAFVQETAARGVHMPTLPYRFLERGRPGVDGLWESLIAEVQRHAPCVLFLAYDQVGNAVVPALTDDIGVVSWVQADDDDYYEQTYRLGRYCNAVICVSSHIRDTIAKLNPAIAQRAHVIHNTTVRTDEIARQRPRRRDRLSIVYTGRLVQYQKRILDFVDLAKALDRKRVPYEITLIGNFVGLEGGTQPEFERRARKHLQDGRIRLLGRLDRDEILQQLRRSAFFALLSDFEGLPLSAVEAMASGCVPVLAHSPSGIPELVADGDNGFLVRGRDYNAWATLFCKLWRDQERLATMSRRARETVRDHFTVDRIGGEFDRVLRQVAGEITDGYARPPALTWGSRSPTGDVMPPPNLFVPENFMRFPGLR